jgi:hypothetical protein
LVSAADEKGAISTGASLHRKSFVPVKPTTETTHIFSVARSVLQEEREQELNNAIMALIENLLSPWTLVALSGLLVASYLYQYFVTFGALRRFPAPFPAQFSNLWLLSVCRRGTRYDTVDKVHKKLGKFVRIQPNHVSIADDEAIQAVYGHGNGFLKAYGSPSPKDFNLQIESTRYLHTIVNSMTHLFLFNADCSTRATAPSTPASER